MKTIPPSLWFKKFIQKPQVRELSRLCPETSKELYVHEFGSIDLAYGSRSYSSEGGEWSLSFYLCLYLKLCFSFSVFHVY
jgi:hypothetical protein